MNNANVRDYLNRSAPRRSLVAVSSAVVALTIFPLAAFAITYLPGQTLNPACLPSDPTCLVATSTFAAGISVTGTASSTNVVVSNTLSVGTLTGFLKAVGGAVSTALVNLTTDVTGILPVANGGTGWANIASGSILFGNGSSAIATSSNIFWDNTNSRLGIGTTTPGSIFSVQGVANWTTSTSTYYSTGGINLTGGCFSVNGTCIGSGGAGASLSVANTWTALQTFASGFLASASSTVGNGTQTGGLTISGGATTTGTLVVSGSGTSTFSGPVSASNLLIGGAPIFVTNGGYGSFGLGVGGATVGSTSGWFNTALGFAALNNATSTGHDETGVGYAALWNTTTGSDNTAVGDQALVNNSTGSANTVMGANVEDSVSSATNTVAIGANAANPGSPFSAQGFTVVGTGAGSGFQTGANYNTLIGYLSGSGITTGTNNTLIGANTSPVSTGSNNIAIGYNVGLPSATASNQLNIGNFIYGTGLSGTGSTVSNGSLGIGTSSPSSRLTVWGPDAASSTLAFNVVSSASSSVFAVFDGGNAELSGTLTQSSDQRLKMNIQSLNASSSLSAIEALNPVTFNWIDPNKGSTLQLGFIAQDVQKIFPNLVSTTSPTARTPDGTLGLNYIGLISPIVSAIQELDQQLTSLANAVAGFAQSFTTDVLNSQQDNTQKLCVGSTCVTPAQFQAMVAAANASQPSGHGSSSNSNSEGSTMLDTPPVIQINGDNPAIIQVGETYNDLGATITGPEQDLNLGITTYVNGTLTSNIVIDTRAVATDTVDYVATDSVGLTATSTRTVIIEAPTAATSTVQ
jgi:hypothetical protein